MALDLRSPASRPAMLPSMHCVSCWRPPAAPSNCPTSGGQALFERLAAGGLSRDVVARRGRRAARRASSCDARTRGFRPDRALRPAASGTGAFGSAAAGRRDGWSLARQRGCGAVEGGSVPSAAAWMPREPAERCTGRRTGAVARRPMPRPGDRVRRGAANHRALGALPAVLRHRASPCDGRTCSAPTFRRAAIRRPQRAQRLTEAGPSAWQ